MAITAAQVKELRDATGISMMECKKALTETNGDIDAAIEFLRKKGLAKAAKKADRATSEGSIKVVNEGNKAYLVALSCETDFVAITPEFDAVLVEMAEALKEAGSEDAAAEKVESIRAEAVMKLGENMTVKHLKIIEGAKIESYIHSNRKLASIVIAKDDSKESEALKQVAMHIVASAPQYLKAEDIEEEVVAKEKEINLEQMKNDPKMEGKPEQVLEKIIEGKINKFKDEISLMTQDFVINPDQKVKDFIGEDTIESFIRLSI